MKKRIIIYKKLVLEIMQENQIARDNDLILYSNILSKFCAERANLYLLNILKK
jgi:hypothetical protein